MPLPYRTVGNSALTYPLEIATSHFFMVLSCLTFNQLYFTTSISIYAHYTRNCAHLII